MCEGIDAVRFICSNPAKWHNNGPCHRLPNMPKQAHPPPWQTRGKMRGGTSGRRVVHVPGTRPDELLPLLFLFWREKRDNAHAGPSYIFNGMIMGDCCNRWLPIFSARWTLSNRFLFLFSSRFVFFIFACCYRSLQNKSRSHRLRLGVESHGIYRIPSPYREPIFELNAKKNWIKKSFFSNYYLYQYKAQRHSPCKGWKKTNKTIGDFLIHLLDSTRLKVSLCFVSTRPNFFSPPTS